MPVIRIELEAILVDFIKIIIIIIIIIITIIINRAMTELSHVKGRLGGPG